MTFAVLNRDGSFRMWVEDPDKSIYRPGALLPQVVDEPPTFDGSTHVAIEGAPVRSGDTMRKTWVVVPTVVSPQIITPLGLLARLHHDLEFRPIMEAAISDPDILAIIVKLAAATEVYTDDQQVRSGLELFIPAGRVNEILTP